MNGLLLPGLRFRRQWLTGGFGLVLVVTILSLVPGEQLPRTGTTDKLNHVLAYVAMALWFGGIFARRVHVRIALVLLAYGALIELLQLWMAWGREAELLDLGADAAGIAAGLMLALTPAGRWAFWVESWQRQSAP